MGPGGEGQVTTMAIPPIKPRPWEDDYVTPRRPNPPPWTDEEFLLVTSAALALAKHNEQQQRVIPADLNLKLVCQVKLLMLPAWTGMVVPKIVALAKVNLKALTPLNRPESIIACRHALTILDTTREVFSREEHLQTWEYVQRIFINSYVRGNRLSQVSPTGQKIPVWE